MDSTSSPTATTTAAAAAATTNIDLPIIDISTFTPAVGKAALAAATKYGFLYIDTASTSFTASIIDRQFAISEQFFALPLDEKKKYQITLQNRGWTGMFNEILDPKNQKRGDWKEAMNLGEFLAGDGDGKGDGKRVPQQELPGWMLEEEVVGELRGFEDRCREMCGKILDLLALGLEIEGDAEGEGEDDGKRFFSKRHTKPSGSTVRLLHYPAVEDGGFDQEVDIRAGAHSDYGSCTLLFQRVGQPGLEIRTPDGKGWASVAVIPDGYESKEKGLPPILLNIGDLLSYWTNGMLKSTVHRVIFPKGETKDRYSIAFFCHPGNEEKLVAVPSKIVKGFSLEEGEEVGYGGGAATHRAITAREHLENRLAATYDFRKPLEA